MTLTEGAVVCTRRKRVTRKKLDFQKFSSKNLSLSTFEVDIGRGGGQPKRTKENVFGHRGHGAPPPGIRLRCAQEIL